MKFVTNISACHFGDFIFYILKTKTYNFCALYVAEILRVSGMIPNHGYTDLDRLQRGSPSHMASSDIIPNNRLVGFSGWNGRPQEVRICNSVIYQYILLLIAFPEYDQSCPGL